MNVKKLIGAFLALVVVVGCSYYYFVVSQNGIQQGLQSAFENKISKVAGPKVAYVTKDFKLPDVNNDLPVYDKYTTKQRKEKGLPLTYGTEREYFYGDHVAYLTFDDGPNKANTAKILDILKKEDIHATFFLLGKNAEKNPDLVKRIYNEGNAMGIHSYSHVYQTLYASPQNYLNELQKTEEIIYNIIGVRPIISRAPGGSAGHFTKAYWNAINDSGYIEVGWNALTGDADGTGRTAATEINNVKAQLQKRPFLNTHLVILMHDAVGHEATVEALPQIIKLLKDQGYTFRVVTTAIPPSW